MAGGCQVVTHYTLLEGVGYRKVRVKAVSGGKTIATSSQISDFGLSKWMEQSTGMQCIQRSALRGTLSYIPPEMFLESNKPPGRKYDVYR